MAKNGMKGYRYYPLGEIVSGKVIKAEFFIDLIVYGEIEGGDPVSQQVTVDRNTGHVAALFKYVPVYEENFTREQNQQAVADSKKTREFDINPDKAEHIFSLLEKHFSRYEDSDGIVEITDIGSWSITLTTDTGDEVEYSGTIGFIVDGMDMADVLKEDLGLPDFYFFRHWDD